MNKSAGRLSFNEALMLALLEIKEGETVDVDALLEKCHIGLPSLTRSLNKAHENGLVTLQGRDLRVTSSQKLSLALTSLDMGIDIEEVCRAGSWQEFEQLAELVLQEEGYSTCRHFRFRSSGQSHEIDVIAMKKPLLLSVECKRWKRSWQLSGLKRIAASHLIRTQSLCQVLCEHKGKLPLSNWSSAEIHPIVLMLGETPTKVEYGVPIVPIHRFRDFFAGFDVHLTEFAAYRCQLWS